MEHLEEAVSKKLKIEDFKITEPPIGKGPISVVYPANSDLVLKRMTISDPETEEYVKKHLECLPILKYANLVEVKEFNMREENGVKICDILMERAKSNLIEFMQNNPDYFNNVDNLIDFFIQMFTTDLLEEMKIPHRNLKPENILFFDKYIFKLADTSLAHRTSLLVNNSIVDFLAPEILRSLDEGSVEIDYNLADVYSLGLLFMLVAGTPLSQINELQNADDSVREELVQKCFDQINGRYGQQWIVDLFGRMVLNEPIKRTPFGDLNFLVYSSCDRNLWRAYYMKTLDLHQRLADEGSPWAMMEMGAIYSGSSFLAINYELSQQWFKKAADAGCKRAKGYLEDNDNNNDGSLDEDESTFA